MKPFLGSDLGDEFKSLLEGLEFRQLAGLYKRFPVYLEQAGCMIMFVENGSWSLLDACPRYLSCDVKEHDNLCVRCVLPVGSGEKMAFLEHVTLSRLVSIFRDDLCPLAQVMKVARGVIDDDASTIEWSVCDENLCWVPFRLSRTPVPLLPSLA